MLAALLNVLGLYATVLVTALLPSGSSFVRNACVYNHYVNPTLIDFLVLAHLVDRTDPLFVLWRRNGGRIVSAISTVGFLVMYVTLAPPRGPQP